MIVTADERRNVLNLFNVSEAARYVGVDVHKLHRDIRAGHTCSPSVLLGRRMYFDMSRLKQLSRIYKESNRNE